MFITTNLPPLRGSSQGDALRLMLAAIATTREASYSHDDVLCLVKDAWEHVERTDQRPHAFGHCTNCGQLSISW